jgi:hypothetical protein
MGGAAPRILSLDAYFMNEVEKLVKDPDTGRRYMRCIWLCALFVDPVPFVCIISLNLVVTCTKCVFESKSLKNVPANILLPVYDCVYQICESILCTLFCQSEAEV